MSFDLKQVTLDQVSEALERLLDAGIAKGKDVTDDPVIFRDSYYAELKGMPSGALDLAVQETIKRAPKWLPNAGEFAALTRSLIPKSKATAPRAVVEEIERVKSEDHLGPLTRFWPKGHEEQYPIPTDPTVTCPAEDCRCLAVFVWAPAEMFGAKSSAWGARWVWKHVARELGLKATTEWNPYKDPKP